VIIRKLVPSAATPEKKPLISWLRTRAPRRSDVREGMIRLKNDLDALVAGERVN
jgi:hypothetical protein